ncbi:hypothetical protein Q3G72_023006 [Acer saccharum]|nr:hypothetical protein Q3G72_023006 [Acer saccharum]
MVAKQTDGMAVHGWPLSSKVASFGWKNRRSKAPSVLVSKFRVEQGREGVYRGSKQQVNHLDNGSFAAVLKRNMKEKLEVVVDRKSFTVSVVEERSHVEIQWLEEQLGLEMEDSLADLISFLDLETEGKKSEKGESLDPFRLKGKFESDIIVRRDRKLREDQGKDRGKAVELNKGSRLFHEIRNDRKRGSKRSVNLTSFNQKREVVAINFRSKSFQDIGKKLLASKPNSKHILFKVCKAKLVVEKRGEISSTEGSAGNVSSKFSEFEDGGGQMVECGKQIGGCIKKRESRLVFSCSENRPNVDGSNGGIQSAKVSTIQKSNQLKDCGSGQSCIGVGPKQFSPMKSSVGFVRGPVGSIHTN